MSIDVLQHIHTINGSIFEREKNNHQEDYELSLNGLDAYDWILKKCIERAGLAGQSYNQSIESRSAITNYQVGNKYSNPIREIQALSSTTNIKMADGRRSSRRIANTLLPPSTSQPRARIDSGSENTPAVPNLRSHSRTASLENARAPVSVPTRTSSSNIRTVPSGRNTRNTTSSNTRNTASRSSARQAQTSKSSSNANTRSSRRRVPSSDSEDDDDDNMDIASDNDLEASESEEEEEEEESEPVPRRTRTTRAAATSTAASKRQQPTRKTARNIPSEDEDAPGETDDGMDIDEISVSIPPAKPVSALTQRTKAEIASGTDEDAEGEPDDDDLLYNVGSSIKHRDGGVVPPLPIPAIRSPSDSSSDLDDPEEDEEEDEDEDAEGEDEEIDDEEDEVDSETPGGMGMTPDISRPDTPDTSRLTRRQKGRYNDYSTELLELPDDFGSTKKSAPLSAAEQANRRAEMARRRKNQSEQRREEEKMETINKLLKKQASKVNRRSQKQLGVDAAEEDGAEITPEPTEPPKMIRWVSNKNGSVLGVPQSWLDAPIGEIYEKHDVAWRRGGKKVGLIEELPDQPMTG